MIWISKAFSSASIFFNKKINMWRTDLDVELCVVIPGLYLEHIKFLLVLNSKIRHHLSKLFLSCFTIFHSFISWNNNKIKRSLESTSSSKWNMRVFISFRFSSYHGNSNIDTRRKLHLMLFYTIRDYCVLSK